LSLQQAPVLFGRTAAPRPKQTDILEQVQPNLYVMTLTDSLGSYELGQILATGSTSYYIDGNSADHAHEYWYVAKDVLAKMGSSTSIAFAPTTMSGANYTSPTYTHRQFFEVPESPGWTSEPSDPDGNAGSLYTGSQGGAPLGLR